MTVREGLPRVPYATALDIFLNMCLVYNLSALIEYAGVNYFTKTGPGSPPENEEDEVSKLSNNDCVTSIGTHFSLIILNIVVFHVIYFFYFVC